MRRIAAAALSAIAAGLPLTPGVAAAARATPAGASSSRKLQGVSAQAGQWGTVTVNVTTQGSGSNAKLRYTDLGGSYTYHTSRSQFIMSQALPELRQEFLTAQSANVQMVSGATYTSEAFLHSLQSALLKAK